MRKNCRLLLVVAAALLSMQSCVTVRKAHGHRHRHHWHCMIEDRQNADTANLDETAAFITFGNHSA